MVIDLSFLQAHLIFPIMGICLCVGYVLKHSFDNLDNKYIPLILSIIGVTLSFLIENSVNIDVILNGLFSALASIGLHEMFRNLIENNQL